MKISKLHLLIFTITVTLYSCNHDLKMVATCIKGKATSENLSILEIAKNIEDSLIKYKFLMKDNVESYKSLIYANFKKHPIPDSVFYSRNIDNIEIVSYPSTSSMIYSCLSMVHSDPYVSKNSLEYRCYDLVRLLHDTGISDFKELDFFFDDISEKDLNDPVVRLLLISLVFLGGS